MVSRFAWPHSGHVRIDSRIGVFMRTAPLRDPDCLGPEKAGPGARSTTRPSPDDPSAFYARNVVFELLDDETLLGNDVLDQITNGNQADELAVVYDG